MGSIAILAILQVVSGGVLGYYVFRLLTEPDMTRSILLGLWLSAFVMVAILLNDRVHHE